MNKLMLAIVTAFLAGCGILTLSSDTTSSEESLESTTPATSTDSTSPAAPSPSPEAPLTSTLLKADKGPAAQELAANAKKASVVITLIAPSYPFDGLRIEFGSEPGMLTHSLDVAAAALERTSDPQHGEVLTYAISDTNPKELRYLRAAFFRGEERSPPSPILEVQASDQAGQ